MTMEQRLPFGPEAINQSHVPVSTPMICKKSSGFRCGLPLGKALVCGDTRHREDRGPDSEVISGGAPGQDVWLIRSGILRLQRHSYDGRRQILSLFFPGEIVGFKGEFRDGVTVETATRSGICRIDQHKFDIMVNQNDVLRAELFRQKQDQLDRLHWLTWSLGALAPEERFCAFLALGSKFMPYNLLPDGTGVLSILLPRKDIADLLGTTVESISRIVHKLSESGLVEIRDPAKFRLLDLPRLVSLGQIESIFDRLTRGMAAGRERIDGIIAPRNEDAVCFCGRQSGPLTGVNDPHGRSDILPFRRSQFAGG